MKKNYLSLTGRLYQEHTALKDCYLGKDEKHGRLSVRKETQGMEKKSIINATVSVRVILHRTAKSPFIAAFCCCIFSQRTEEQS